MPPEESGGKLPDSEIALLTEWVRRGAPDPRIEAVKRGGMTEKELREWWSFQPLKPVPIPVVPEVHNPVDHFIRARLVAE